jgi:hypothetical protein
VAARKPDPELTINLWLVKIAARGNEAISAVKWPVAIVLCALALVVLLVGYSHADLIMIRSAVRSAFALFGH